MWPCPSKRPKTTKLKFSCWNLNLNIFKYIRQNLTHSLKRVIYVENWLQLSEESSTKFTSESVGRRPSIKISIRPSKIFPFFISTAGAQVVITVYVVSIRVTMRIFFISAYAFWFMRIDKRIIHIIRILFAVYVDICICKKCIYAVYALCGQIF